MSWTPQNDRDYNLMTGFEMYDRDGQDLGKVVQVIHPRPNPPREEQQDILEADHFFVVRASDALPADEYFIPASAIERVEPDQIHINLPASQIANLDWTERPA